MIDYNKTCLDGCKPKQILNINGIAFNNIDNIVIVNDCGDVYDMSSLEYAYSMDNVCWSCYMSYKEFLEMTIDLKQDYYIRFKIAGSIGKILIDNEEWTNYSTQIDSTFNLSNTTPSSNMYNPYINMDCAISLYQNLTESISNMIGIGCYYFKLSPNVKSRDITFKEYALMDVSAVKQIKIIINENQMPSSKPEFNDFGLDWQTDWEVDVSKVAFATAFGNTIQPTSGDLVYIPMMKRMWMVNEAYEEKKDAFMWNATTFKLALVKYQEKDSVDLGNTEDLVNSFVKNKYDDLFGDEENVSSQFDAVNISDKYNGQLYQVYKSDAIRKAINIDNIEISETSTYFRGTLISDLCYKIMLPNANYKEIEYQKTFCSENGTLSFIFSPNQGILTGTFISIGNFVINIEQSKKSTKLTCKNINGELNLILGKTYLVWIRWDKVLNYADFSCAEYKYNTSIPIYKLQPAHYFYDLDNPYQKNIKKYNIELNIPNKSSLIIYSFYGTITNIKLFDIYVDNLSEVLQMYPTHNHLLINDTARKLITLNGSHLG